MDRKKVILLVAALFIAAITAFLARSMFTGAAAPTAAAAKPVETGPKVMVATKALPVGTIITADSFRYQPWPKELVEDAYFIETPGGGEAPDGATANAGISADELVGTVVRNSITAGQPITKGSLVKPGDRGFLAAALGPGMRAVTVPVSALTGVAGFVFPGDRVDLVLTQNIAGPGGPPLKVSETILRNMRVLATDQRSTNAVDEAGNTVVRKYKLVTMEATPSIAERITVAQSLGTISLSLRSLADNAAELEQALASGEVSIPEGATAEQEDAIMKKVAQRPISGKSTYTTGGDVSRFQRSSIPAQTPLAIASENVRIQRQVQKVVSSQTVRVSRAGAETVVDVSRRQ
ncbi:Flp pilus assembly protein CpaB [Sphingorhabdus sp. IMCC26285]|jgi:pilus assembly protein CpaB|uniref:Flp pilus assembly protein CpaB n=1 Tax=Sphingorhabdus profundilacus TaxID=2509718 RepID=A0A6I4LZL0_9SPHN|nr:Flp pilus assembly protein CpaB [Sphingorhabdus profundilacus]MVZ97364.1 Flp pilus assembly protein CpaB [Sphingorhabdus profundilacus]